MHSMFRISAPLLLCLALAGCGGGGSSSPATPAASPAPPSNPEGAWLTFSQGEVSGYAGENIPFQITATNSSHAFTKPVNVAVIDTSGLITTDRTGKELSVSQYRTTLATSSTLSVGTHQANLEVRLCEDDPVVCRKPLPGSPWFVPVTVTVRPASEAANRVTLSAPSLSMTTYPGEQTDVYFSGQFSAELAGQSFNVRLVDRSGLMETAIESQMSDHFAARLTSSRTVQSGEYSSSVEVYLCRDAVEVCSKPLAGSPWVVPVKISAKPSTNLSPLAPVAGLGSWSTYQGNAAHTGYVAASFDPAAFSRRWSFSGPATLNAVTNDNGKVFLTQVSTPSSYLAAIDEATGAESWRIQVSNSSWAHPPAAANGQVYVATSDYNDPAFWIINQRDGTVLGKSRLSGVGTFYLAPVVVGTDVYTTGGLGISKFSTQPLTLTWGVRLPVSGAFSPAVDARYSYAYIGGMLYALGLADGQEAWSLADIDYPFDAKVDAPVVLSPDLAFVAQRGHLMAYDLSKHAYAWTVSGQFMGQPAYGNGALYMLNAKGTRLEARSAADGALLWKTGPLPGEFDKVIVTRNLAFISWSRLTLAIDLNTHQVVWSYPRGGDLSISRNGVLYIAQSSGTLVAINLK